MSKKSPDNIGNPIAAMNFYNGVGQPPKKKKRQQKWKCVKCGGSIPDGYVQCLNNCEEPKP